MLLRMSFKGIAPLYVINEKYGISEEDGQMSLHQKREEEGAKNELLN